MKRISLPSTFYKERAALNKTEFTSNDGANLSDENLVSASGTMIVNKSQQKEKRYETTIVNESQQQKNSSEGVVPICYTCSSNHKIA